MHFDPVNPTLTPHEWVRSIYVNMLALFTEEDVIAFWECRPMTLYGKTFSTRDLLSHIWLDKAMVPVAWDYAVGEALEAFLVPRGISIREFYALILSRNNGSTFMPGRYLLKWFYPVVHKLFDALDPRDMMIKLLPYFTENTYPHHVHRRVKREVRDGIVENTMVYITDRSFREVLHFDVDVHAGEQIKACPGIFSMPPFDSVSTIADCRPLSMALWRGAVTEDGGMVALDGRRIGRRTRFAEFLAAIGVDLSAYQVPEQMVILVEEDVVCPLRQRVVLYSGCAYEAPVYLQVVRHRKGGGGDPDTLLSNIVDDISEDETTFVRNSEARHLRVMARLDEALDFVYHAADTTMSLGGETLVKGVGAVILRIMLSAYRKEGKVEFEYRDFKREDEVSLGQKNSNFEVRFYRLLERLKEKQVPIEIEKVGKGRFRMKVLKAMSLAEVA